MNISIVFEIETGHPIYGSGRPTHGGDVHSIPMWESIISSDISFGIFKIDAGVHFMDGDVYFKISFRCQIAVELLSDGQKSLSLYSVTPYHASMNMTPAYVFKIADEYNIRSSLGCCRCVLNSEFSSYDSGQTIITRESQLALIDQFGINWLVNCIGV